MINEKYLQLVKSDLQKIEPQNNFWLKIAKESLLSEEFIKEFLDKFSKSPNSCLHFIYLNRGLRDFKARVLTNMEQRHFRHFL